MNMIQQTIDPEEDGVDFQSFSHGLYIGGRWVRARGGREIAVIDPSTEAVIAAVPDATVEDAADAVEAAAAAAEGWRNTPPRKRSEILRRCYELMIERGETLPR